MSLQQQRTQWALELFRGFVETWTPPAMHEHLLDDDQNAGERVRAAIRSIAPKGDETLRVGWAVFRREHDTDYDRERPSGWVHTQVGAVFETTTQVANVLQGCQKRDPAGIYLICEIKETQ